MPIAFLASSKSGIAIRNDIVSHARTVVSTQPEPLPRKAITTSMRQAVWARRMSGTRSPPIRVLDSTPSSPWELSLPRDLPILARESASTRLTGMLVLRPVPLGHVPHGISRSTHGIAERSVFNPLSLEAAFIVGFAIPGFIYSRVRCLNVGELTSSSRHAPKNAPCFDHKPMRELRLRRLCNLQLVRAVALLQQG